MPERDCDSFASIRCKREIRAEVPRLKRLRENIKLQFKLNLETGANLRKLIQSTVVKELTAMIESDKKSFVPKRGVPNVIMFVGL